MAFSFVAVGIMVLTAIIIAVIVVSGDSSSSDSSPAGSPGGVDSTPGASTTAPVSGGWSSGG
ncbi:hypothetical protein [Brevibacterium spongiae]|uniref:Uncharacterized protein n=1 Tax=Brevibacterium spongiae TaxID=2909672 RepID=A0ABY5SMV3_9MICO|nr:hypothetical protein [Brevibacterium spongiae]UVI35848.1 hypothetical protein L1F31_17295 [Brevibacterium spongiae]